MTDQPHFELYSFWRSSATYRVRVAMSLKGLAAKEHFIDLDNGGQRDKAFLEINPLGAVPALIEPEQAPLTQSIAILEYLDETHPQPPLLPRDPRERARVRSIAASLAGDTHPLIVPRIKKYLMSNAGFDDAAWRAWQTHWFTTNLRGVEARLAGDRDTGRFCHGESVTIADICLASVIAVMRVFKIEVSDVPTVDRIVAACEGIEAFAEADPMKQEGAPA